MVRPLGLPRWRGPASTLALRAIPGRVSARSFLASVASTLLLRGTRWLWLRVRARPRSSFFSRRRSLITLMPLCKATVLRVSGARGMSSPYFLGRTLSSECSASGTT
jgi:hypothetical protein